MQQIISNTLRITILLVLAAILAFQFWSQRAPRPLHLPPQQQVATNNPKIGVHTRLTGVGDEQYIARSLEQAREMGATWIVDLFPWAYAQPRSRYGFDWAGSDMVVEHASRQGLTVVARLDIVPQWARPLDSSDRLLDQQHYVDYADYVVAFAQRYRPYGLRHLLIWNEPNLAFEWGRRKPSPEAYAALLKIVYRRVKAAVPDAIVIAGALSPQSEPGANDARMNDMLYLERMYAAGAAPFFDMWGAHTYGYRSPPDAAPGEMLINLRRVELVHNQMLAHGDDKPIIITEGGWNDSPRWTAAVLPSQRLRWTVEAYAMAKQWDWLAAMCLWQFGTPQPAHTLQDNWSFVASDGTPKAIYWAVRESAVP
jgi:hypothetical protein